MKASDADFRLINLKARRKRWLSIHLWLGLTLGFLLAIYGLTGSILVFHEEIDEWLNPELLTVLSPNGNQPYKLLTEIIEAGQQAMPKSRRLGCILSQPNTLAW